MPTAFLGPLKLKQRLGGLDAAEIAGTDPDRLVEVFREKPAIHRFPGNMAKRVQELCAVVDEDYGGDAGRVWGDAADTADLKQRIEALPGFGEMKVKALASVLARRYGERDGGAARPRPRRCSGTSTRPRRSPSTRRRSAPTRPRCGPQPLDRAPVLPRRRPDRRRRRKPGRRVPRRRARRASSSRSTTSGCTTTRRRSSSRRCSARRSAASRSGSSTTSTTPGRSRCRRRRRPRRSCSRRSRSRRARSPACPT